MIPETRADVVKKALQEAFEVSEYEEIRQLTAGLSPDLIYRIVVRGKPYLLRVINRPGVNYEPRHFACMTVGAAIGIAPRIYYMNIEDRILITDFIEARPFPQNLARVLMPGIIRRLHDLPPFPRPLNWLDYVNGTVRRIREAKILPEKVTGEIFRQYDRVIEIYPRDQDLVSSHNDLKPENCIFDGVRPWLVDWEAAFLNDRYLDLAVVANFVVRDDRDEAGYLRAYFGETAGEYRSARFFLMRQIAHMSYFSFIMMLASKGKPVDPGFTPVDFRDYHDRMWAGGISLVSNEERLLYARIHMEQALQNMQTRRFEDSLMVVAGHHQ